MIRTSLAIVCCCTTLTLWACGEAPLSSDVTDIYPFSYPAMGMEELKQRNEQYQSRNDHRICSTLNEYALTGYSRILFENDVNPCLGKELIRQELSYSEALVDMARASLAFNKEFTEIDDPSLPEVKEIQPLNGCTICEGPDINNVPLEWKISFREQMKDDVRVDGTEITVYIDAQGVNRIWGNWYEIVDPGLAKVGYREAREKFKDRRLLYENDNGEIIEQRVSIHDVEEIPELIYAPVFRNESVELRKSWAFKISRNSDGLYYWKGFVDVMTGEIVKLTLIELH